MYDKNTCTSDFTRFSEWLLPRALLRLFSFLQRRVVYVGPTDPLYVDLVVNWVQVHKYQQIVKRSTRLAVHMYAASRHAPYVLEIVDATHAGSR